MAIQFRCPGCSNPIEVDDPYAGQSAQCPYCRRVVAVPLQSEMAPLSPPAARPAQGVEWGAAPPVAGPPPPPGALHVGPSETPRERAARTFANYALICALLAVGLLGASVFDMFRFALAEVSRHPESQPSQRWFREIAQTYRPPAWVPATSIGMAFFGAVGLALSLVSLSQSTRRNWRAVVSLVVCGLLATCCAVGVLTSAGS